MVLLGYQWLLDHLGLPEYPLPVASRLGSRLRVTHNADGSTDHEYPAQYAPAETVTGHLEFALKHEGVNLAVLFDVFRVSGAAPIEAAISARPTSQFSKRMGFYYELLTEKRLDEGCAIGGNYIDALDSERYYVAPKPVRNRRWRVWNNLPGDARYCPVVRRTPLLEAALAAPLREDLAGLIQDFPPALFQRANDYLYLKETRSTYGIEREAMPNADRAERFVSLLKEAGEGNLGALLTERELTRRQNFIVDPRYAAPGFRADQNYVGEQRPDYTQRIHYVCPPPQWVASLIDGLATAAERMEGLPALVRSAAVGFGFVYIHPFDDGNGRLHRFLLHDLLRRDGFLPPGVMLPVSATMIRRMDDYNAALARYSAPLLAGRVVYDLNAEGRMTLLNPQELEAYYRFPDFTTQAEYLATTVAMTIHEDFREELRFLRSYDGARNAVRAVIDMPDRKLDLLLRLLHQNGGKLSTTKREKFAELTPDELAHIEAAFSEAFG